MKPIATLVCTLVAPLAALVAAPLLASAALADAVVTLRSTLEVTGETVVLSDLFDGVPVDTDVAVVRAPTPGQTLSIDPDWLRAYARRNELDWPNASGVRRVTVRRASQAVHAETIIGLVSDALTQRSFSDYAVTLSNPNPLHAPIDAALAPQVRNLTYDPISNVFTGEITLTANGETHRITGRAEIAVALPVLVRGVARGEVIQPEDITFVSTPASRAPADALLDIDSLVGMAAKRALRAGVALKPFDLQRPTIIARGDIVLIRFSSGSIELTTRARALDDVAQGDQARFVNLQSSRIIEAVASEPGVAWLAASNPTGFIGGRP